MAEEKILKSEEMSEEELDNVAGGNYAELAKMTQLFATLGFTDRSYSAAEINISNIGQIAAGVNQILNNLGMNMNYNSFGKNAYTAGGDASGSPTNVLTHNQAVVEAIKRAGRSNDVAPKAFYV